MEDTVTEAKMKNAIAYFGVEPPIDTRAGYLVIINDEHINYHRDLADLMGAWTPAACFDWHYGESSDALRAKVCTMHGVDDLDALYDYANDEGDDEARSMFWGLLNAGHTSEPIALRNDSKGAIIGAMAIANQWVDDSIADIDSCAVMEPIPTLETATGRYNDLKAIKNDIVAELQATAGETDGFVRDPNAERLKVQLQTVSYALADTKSVMMAYSAGNKVGKRYRANLEARRARLAPQMEASK
jgi:hypothetical protein